MKYTIYCINYKIMGRTYNLKTIIKAMTFGYSVMTVDQAKSMNVWYYGEKGIPAIKRDVERSNEN